MRCPLAAIVFVPSTNVLAACRKDKNTIISLKIIKLIQNVDVKTLLTNCMKPFRTWVNYQLCFNMGHKPF